MIAWPANLRALNIARTSDGRYQASLQTDEHAFNAYSVRRSRKPCGTCWGKRRCCRLRRIDQLNGMGGKMSDDKIPSHVTVRGEIVETKHGRLIKIGNGGGYFFAPDELDVILEPSEKRSQVSDIAVHLGILDDMEHDAKYAPATRYRQAELRIQALGAAISRKDWHATEQAYNAIRDDFHRYG